MRLLDRHGRARLAHTARFLAHVVRERRAIARRMNRVPRPIPWDWAKPRLLPFLSGPSLDDPDAPLVRATAEPGCAIEFGVDLGGPFVLVDANVAERWECRPEQLRDVAISNLRRRAARLSAASLRTGVFSGRIVRMLRGPRYAASVILLKDELMRLFGDGDQVFATPSSRFLISFPIETPPRVVAGTVVDLEMREPLPLLYEPFVLSGGRLSWQPPASDDEDEEYLLTS